VENSTGLSTIQYCTNNIVISDLWWGVFSAIVFFFFFTSNDRRVCCCTEKGTAFKSRENYGRTSSSCSVKNNARMSRASEKRNESHNDTNRSSSGRSFHSPFGPAHAVDITVSARVPCVIHRFSVRCLASRLFRHTTCYDCFLVFFLTNGRSRVVVPKGTAFVPFWRSKVAKTTGRRRRRVP